MPKPSILNDALSLHADLIAMNPGGVNLSRDTFRKLLVVGYRKSVEAADRITKTGEAAGLWTRGNDWKKAWVEVHAKPTSPVSQPVSPQGTPAQAPPPPIVA